MTQQHWPVVNYCQNNPQGVWKYIVGDSSDRHQQLPEQQQAGAKDCRSFWLIQAQLCLVSLQMRTVPEKGRAVDPETRRSRVDLPHPLGPRMQLHRPPSRCMDSSVKRGVASKDRLTRSKTIAGAWSTG